MRKRLSKDRKFAGMLRENALIEELNSAESAAPFSLRGCRVPSKALFTAKHLTVFGLFRIALSKRRGENKKDYMKFSGRLCTNWLFSKCKIGQRLRIFGFFNGAMLMKIVILLKEY